FHHRMPVILDREVEDDWIDPTITEPEAIMGMATAYEGELEAYPVSRAVNNVRNNEPSLIEPIEE
ncbi:MAG: SOS response-associated peptidase, partial [Chloroflexota bacterium]|nr:SOS response-associated peptidase [Chloroflexota bacterium]